MKNISHRRSRGCPSASAVARTPLQLKLAVQFAAYKILITISLLSLTLAPQNNQHLIDGLQCEVISPPIGHTPQSTTNRI